MNIFEELDLKNWKLPVEPQQLVMLYLAYKLINKLDTTSLVPQIPKPVVKPVNQSGGIFIIVFFVFVAYLLCSSLIDRINVSSVFIDDLRPNEIVKKKCPMKNLGNCPISRCPLFGSTKAMEETLMKMCPEYNPNVKECPMFKKCPMFNKCNKKNLSRECKDICPDNCKDICPDNCKDICPDNCKDICPKECKKEENSDFS